MMANAPNPHQTFESEHLNLIELKEKQDLEHHGYLLHKNIPQYPENVEFSVSSVFHVTNESGMRGILSEGGFMAGEKRGSFIWWGLNVSQSEIMEAQQLYLDREFPNKQAEDDLLSKFTTSPAFTTRSRYGNFKFTFHLEDLLQMYQTQICEQREPILRVFQTVVFKQEIMYVVVVYDPKETQFDRYPLLQDVEKGAVCAYRKGKIIWRAQALCNTHNYELTSNTDLVMATPAENCNRFYVWDHVTLAFHVHPDKKFEIKRDKLLHSLSACDMMKPFYEKRVPLDLDKALKIVGDLKPSEN